MIELLLFALNLSDAELYKKIEINSNVFDQLTEINEEFGIAIIGPKIFNFKENHSYPLFSIWKINNFDNKFFIPPDMAFIVVNQVETSKLTIIRLDNAQDKMPPPGETGKIQYPPGYNANAKQYTFDEIWKDITSRDITWIDGHYTMQVICGKMFSNNINVEVTETGCKAEDILIQNEKKRVPQPETIQKSHFEQSSFSPKIPEMLNTIEIKAICSNTPNTVSPVVYGSFKLPRKIVKNNYSVELSLIVQFTSEVSLTSRSICIPIEFTTNKDEALSGFFSYDLKELFFNSFTKKLNVPDVVLVNVLSGTVMSNMVEVVNGKSE